MSNHRGTICKINPFSAISMKYTTTQSVLVAVVTNVICNYEFSRTVPDRDHIRLTFSLHNAARVKL